MGFKALTVNTAAEAAGHIYAEDDAAIFQSMFGGDGVLNIGNCLKSTVISNNKVRISDGVLSVGGHIGRLSHADYQDMTIENGATGYNRNDIIYARFLTSGNVDSFILAVKKGTATTGIATDPSLVQGNLYEGAVERDYPLYRVKLSGLSISSVDQLFTVIPTIPDLKAQMEKDKAEINQSLANKNRDTVICRPETTIYDNDSPDLYTEFTCEQNPNDFNLFTAIVSEAYIQTPVYIKEWYSDTEDVINISSGRTIPTDKHNYQYFYAMITWERNQTAPYKIKVRRARQFFVTSTDGVSVEKIGFDGNLYIPVLQGIK